MHRLAAIYCSSLHTHAKVVSLRSFPCKHRLPCAILQTSLGLLLSISVKDEIRYYECVTIVETVSSATLTAWKIVIRFLHIFRYQPICPQQDKHCLNAMGSSLQRHKPRRFPSNDSPLMHSETQIEVRFSSKCRTLPHATKELLSCALPQSFPSKPFLFRKAVTDADCV